MIAFGGSRVENLLAQQRRKQERVALADRCCEERNHEISIRARRHQSGDDFGGGGVAAILLRIGDDRVGEAMLIVDGDDRADAACVRCGR